MAVHRSHLGLILHVPDLHLARRQPHADVGPVVAPLQRRNVRVRRRLQQRTDAAAVGGPNVHRLSQTDCNLVVARPIQNVQVVVINNVRGVQDALRGSQDPAPKLARGCVSRLQRPVVLRPQVDRRVGLRRRWLEGKNPSVEMNATRRRERGLVSDGVGSRLRPRIALVVTLACDVVVGSSPADVKRTGAGGEDAGPVVQPAGLGPRRRAVQVQLAEGDADVA